MNKYRKSNGYLVEKTDAEIIEIVRTLYKETQPPLEDGSSPQLCDAAIKDLLEILQGFRDSDYFQPELSKLWLGKMLECHLRTAENPISEISPQTWDKLDAELSKDGLILSETQRKKVKTLAEKSLPFGWFNEEAELSKNL